MKNFKASCQYNDFTDSSASDNADMKTFQQWLEQNNHIDTNEQLIGIQVTKHSIDNTVFSITVLTTNNVDNNPIHVREQDIEMNISEFFSYFKRFQITLSPKGMLENKEYSVKSV